MKLEILRSLLARGGTSRTALVAPRHLERSESEAHRRRRSAAQVGGPKDIKPVKTDGKPAPSKAPSSVTQRFEHEGMAVDFSIKSTPADPSKDEGLVAGSNAPG